MTTKATALRTIAFFMFAAVVSAQQPVTKMKSVSATATIEAIDKTTRAVTLRNEKGEEEIYTAGPDVQRFDELKVGDKVKMTYYESIVLQVRKPGEEKAAETPVGTAMTRAQGSVPGGTLAAQEKTTVTVKAIDPATPSITVTTADGRTVTRKVEDKKNLEGVKVGDQIDITYTIALLTHVEHAK
jgi:hypothetical protein